MKLTATLLVLATALMAPAARTRAEDVSTLPARGVTAAPESATGGEARAETTRRGRPLAIPRLEIGVGALLVPTSVVTTIAIGLIAGPGLFPCGIFSDETDPEVARCESRARDEQRNAWIAGGLIGTVVGLAGVGLMVHGGLRVHRLRSTQKRGLTVTPAQVARNGYGLRAELRF